MRKTITICALLISMSSVSSYATMNFDKNKKDEDSARCKPNAAVDAMFGTWVLSEDKTVLTLSIADCEESGMTEVFTGDLKKGFFVQDDDFLFPEDICKLLGSKDPIEIKAGKYKVVHLADKYVVTFDL